MIDCPSNFAWSQGSTEVTGAVELARVVAGNQSGRENDAEKIVFVHSGMAVNHVGAGYLTYQRAKEKRLGTEFPIL